MQVLFSLICYPIHVLDDMVISIILKLLQKIWNYLPSCIFSIHFKVDADSCHIAL